MCQCWRVIILLHLAAQSNSVLSTKTESLKSGFSSEFYYLHWSLDCKPPFSYPPSSQSLIPPFPPPPPPSRPPPPGAPQPGALAQNQSYGPGCRLWRGSGGGGEVVVMLASLLAGSTGITVTCAQQVVLTAPYWNPFVSPAGPPCYPCWNHLSALVEPLCEPCCPPL